jgi:hypothetical protein
MSAKEKSNGEKGPVRLVSLLLRAADGDTAFRDLYLQRAAAQLAEVMPEREYRTLSAEQSRVDVLLRQVQVEVRNQSWERVKELSGQVERLRQALRQKADALALAGLVYDAEDVRVDPFSSGLASFALPPGETLANLRQALVAALRDLAKADSAWAEFYGGRQRYFEEKVLATEEPAAETKAPSKANVSELRVQAQLAAERGDAAALQRLADQITQASAAASKEEAAPSGERRPEVSGSVWGAVSTEPFPAASLERAAKLGLEHVCPKERFAEMPAVLTDFLAGHAWQPGLSAQDVAQEGAVHLRDRLSGLELPAELKGPMVELAALFALHPFINSCGVRYFGAAPGEYVLLETFPEDAEPPADSGIPSLLGLERRRGLARVEIEEALRRRGAALLQEQLGLEPREFRLVCVPFDVYNRAGAERGWGGQPQWTHVDGYAVQRGGRLGALAAGHVRYGGLQDLVILGRTDQRETVTTRFCVVRRSRFLPATG